VSEEAPDNAPAADEDSEARALLWLADPDAVGEADVEALGTGLGREVVQLEPGFLDAEALSRLEQAAAVVVSWDIGVQAGLDVLEALRGDERMQATPILMSSPEPTPAAVRLALDAGANGFLFEPLEAEALRPHLDGEEAAGSTPASAAEEGGSAEP